MSKRPAGWTLEELEKAAKPRPSRTNVDPSAAAKILRHARYTAAKDAALDTLTKAACPEAADLIAAALRTGEATTRWKALKALNKIGETAVREHEFEPTLRALAEDAVESVRNAAKDELEDREW